MGHKSDPRSLRIKITDTWKSRWFARGKRFATILEQDTKIREIIAKKYAKAGIVRIDVERLNQETHVIVYSTRPGMIIGKGGGGIEELKKMIRKAVKLEGGFRISIEESKSLNLEASVWAQTLAEQIEKRLSYRRAMKTAIEQIMESGAQGVRIEVSGRLGGAEIARSEKLFKGKLPLHTLRANIDFARGTAYTTYGTVGIKVWINKGEVFGGEEKTSKPGLGEVNKPK